MIIAYFSNFLNHHQKLVADELASTEGIDYIFVETVPMYDWLKKGGYTDYSQVSYVLRAWENEENRQKAIELAKTADVALFGGPEVLYLEVIRAKNTDKISFEVSERWLKRGWLNLLSPRLIKSLCYYRILFWRKPFYKLCASAFGASDQYKLHTYKNRCYKWGYFTTVDKNFDVKASQNVRSSETTSLMWCSRFLKCKHPELPILMAKRLKEKGYRFSLDMFGSGEKLKEAKRLASDLGVTDMITFKGNMPNAKILQEMRKHEIFLFTSDRNEGWGAVSNESMSNGCILVGSDGIGSIPFLVEDGVSGITFKSANTDSGFIGEKLQIDEKALSSLTEKVELLLNHPIERKQIAIQGYENMRDVWSPANAAKHLLLLIDDLQKGRDCSISHGPCSKAI